MSHFKWHFWRCTSCPNSTFNSTISHYNLVLNYLYLLLLNHPLITINNDSLSNKQINTDHGTDAANKSQLQERGDFWLTREVSLKHRFSNLSKLFRFCQDQLSLIDSETFQHLHNYFELLRKFTNSAVLGSKFSVIMPSEMKVALYIRTTDLLWVLSWRC